MPKKTRINLSDLKGKGLSDREMSIAKDNMYRMPRTRSDESYITDADREHMRSMMPMQPSETEGYISEAERRMMQDNMPEMKKGGMTKSQKKVGSVMREFKAGKLHSGKKGPVVKNPKQAIAIALSEAGKSKMKKRGGGIAERGMGSALRGGGEAIAGMGAALKDGGKVFGGKESYDEELGEAKAVVSKKISPKEFVKGEKSEGEKTGEKNTSNIAKKIASGKMSPKQYATMETSEKMQDGGMVRGSGAAIRGLKKVRIY